MSLSADNTFLRSLGRDLDLRSRWGRGDVSEYSGMVGLEEGVGVVVVVVLVVSARDERRRNNLTGRMKRIVREQQLHGRRRKLPASTNKQN